MIKGVNMKYYGINDLSTSYYYSYVIAYIDKFKNQNLKNINDYLILYNVINYASEINLNIREQKLNDFLSNSKKQLGEYFGKIDISSTNFKYDIIKNQYEDNFWECCSKFNNLNKVSAKAFKNFINDNDVSMFLILKNKKIISRYNNVIKEILLENPIYFEFFIRYYSDKNPSFHFPNNITEEEVDDWANSYLDSTNSNLNYIEQLSKWSNHHIFKLKDQLILKARRCYKNMSENLMREGITNEFVMQVKLVDKLDTIIEVQLEGANPTILIDKKFLLAYTRNQEILFIIYNLFNLFGNKGHYLLLPYKIDNNILDILKTIGKHEYKYDILDDYNKYVFKLVFHAYYKLLKSNDINLERALFSYFKEIMKEKFKDLIFFVNSSELGSSYYSKCKSIFPEIDSIFQQYNILRENGRIELELLEMRTGEVDYRELKSFRDYKFAYIKSEKIEELIKTLFSKNSHMAYTKTNTFMPFYIKILTGLNIENLNDKQRILVDELLVYNLIKIDITGDINFVDEEIWLFLSDLYQYEYAVLSNYSDNIVEKIDNIFGSELLKFDNKLFSTQEINYISYMLDNKKYSNSRAIRNKYIHGNNTNKNDSFHLSNYLEVLMLIILFIKRIDEEITYAYNNNLLSI